MKFNDIFEGVIKKQKTIGVRPDVVYISVDIAVELEKDFDTTVFKSGYLLAKKESTGSFFSLHGSCIDGIEYHVLLGTKKNIVSYGYKELNFRARKLMECRCYSDLMGKGSENG